MVKLIAVDMDGTFLNSQKTYDKQRFQVILDELKKRKIRFVVASGNQYAQLASFFPEYIEDITFIAENGMLILDKGEILFEKHFSKELILAVTVYLKETYPGIQMVINGMKASYLERRMSSKFKQLIQFYCPAYEWVEDLLALDFENEKYIKFVLDVPPSKTESISQDLSEKFSKEILPVSSGHGNIDLIVPGNDKANGLKILSDRWKISPQEMMAFGDGQNDLTMLKYVGHSYAMSNAAPVVKQAAKYEAPHNNKNGVLQVLEEYLFKGTERSCD